MAETEANHSAQGMWDTKWKSRDLQNLSARLATAAQKASAITGCPEAQELSAKLLDLSENIAGRGRLFVKLRERPLEATRSLDDEEQRLFTSWPLSLSVNILSQVGTSLATRVDLASVKACLSMSSLAALKADPSGKRFVPEAPYALNLSILMLDKTKPADVADALNHCMGLQVLFVVTLAEKLLRMTDLNAFVALWSQISSSGLVPDAASLAAFALQQIDAVAFCHGWAPHAAIDLCVLGVAAELLKAKAQNQQPSAALRTVAKQLVNNKASISVRVRAACAPRSSGCHNAIVGTTMWEMATAIHIANQSSGKHRDTFLGVWGGIDKLGEIPEPLLAAADAITEFVEDHDVENQVDVLSEAFEALEGEDEEVSKVKQAVCVMLDKLRSVAQNMIETNDMCDTYLSSVFTAAPSDYSATAEDEQEDLIFAWLGSILPIAQKLAAICASPCSSLLAEVCTRVRTIMSAIDLRRDFSAAITEETFTGEAASTFINQGSAMWQNWSKIQTAAIVQESDVFGRWLVRGLRPRRFEQFSLHMLRLCLAKHGVVEQAISAGSDLQLVLPAEASSIVSLYSKWQHIQNVANKVMQCKLVGQYELSQAAGHVHDMKGTVIGGVDVEKLREACGEVTTGYGKAMDAFIKKNGSIDEEGTKRWIAKFQPIEQAVESWDFSGLAWFGKDPESPEGKEVRREVLAMESIVLVAATRSREVENLLPAVAWDQQRQASLQIVLRSLNILEKESSKIKHLLALMVITEVLCRDPKPATHEKDIEAVTSYINGKLGIKDLATLGGQVAAKLGSGAAVVAAPAKPGKKTIDRLS